MTFSVRFEFVGAGWIDIHLAADGRTHHLDWLSYLTPVLDDVLRAAIAIATGAHRADAIFEREGSPGLRLRFEKRWDQQSGEAGYFVTVASTTASLFGEIPPEAAFDLQWEAAVESADALASAVLAGARALEAEHGHAGYAEKWVDGAFPVRAVAALEAALDTAPLPDPRFGGNEGEA